eukprot:Gb_06335 [translate_table: standard]
MAELQAEASSSSSSDAKAKQDVQSARIAVKSPLMDAPRGFCLFGGKINTEELRRNIVIPEYLRIAMAEAVRSKGFVYDAARHKGNGSKSPEAPIVVFINSKSGGRQGPTLKKRLEDLISREQISDEGLQSRQLYSSPPEDPLSP